MQSVRIFQELSLKRSLWLVRSVCPFRNHVIFSTEFSCFLFHNIIAHLRVQKIKFQRAFSLGYRHVLCNEKQNIQELYYNSKFLRISALLVL